MTDREGALELALAAAGMGVWVWRTADGRVEWDARMEQLFGCEEGTFGGTFESWVELLHEDDREGTLQVFRDAVESRAPFHVVHRVGGSGDGDRWVESWGKVFVDDATGEVTGARGVVVDVTERMAAERQLARVQERLRLLAHSGILLASSLELDQTLKNLGRVLVPVLADACEVVLIDGDRYRRYVIAVDDDIAALRESADVPDIPHHPVRRVVASGLPELLRLSVSPDDFGPPEVPTSARALGVTAAALEPIRARGDVRGVLSVSWFEEPEDVEERAALLPDLAYRAALAIENARLFHVHRETSITLQRALLPDDLATPAGFAVATRYHPGHAGVEVGGDWYDVTIGRAGNLQASVGDVVGQGIVAAASMVRIRTALRTLLFDRTPAQAVAELARHAAVDAAGFVTVLAASIDPDGTAMLCCAGHLPPLLVRPGSDIEVLDMLADPALGVPRAEYRQIELQLPPQARLVMFTDGLVERRRVALDAGLARLVDVVRRARDEDLQTLADRIVAEMLDADAHDDAALMIVELPATLA